MDRIILLEKIVDKKITQKEAAGLAGITERQIRRLIKAYEERGTEVFLIRTNRVSNNKIDLKLEEQVIKIIKEKYVDFGPTLISEKLAEIDAIKVSRATIRKWLISSILWQGKPRKCARIHQSRESRSRFGELVQIDGSPHDWFEGRAPKCCLLVFIDDATSKIITARFEESETTVGYMRCIREHVKRYGRALAYYRDRHSIFKTTRECGAKEGVLQDTNLHKALKQLNIELICANSPQAKGRVERVNQTLQDRLIKDMRLAGVSSIEAGNAYLEGYIKKHNDRFGVEALNKEDAHRKLVHNEEELKLILSTKETRKINKNLEFSLHNAKHQIINAGKGHRMRQGVVSIYNTSCGELKLLYEGKELEYRVLEERKWPIIADSKEIGAIINDLINLVNLNELSTSPESTIRSA
jgi:transposase